MDRQPLDSVRRLAFPEFWEAGMSQQPANSREESSTDLIARLNLPIEDILILRRALTHRSYINEHPEALEDNERLEFLGDAVLDFIVGAWLYNHFPEMAEGELTRMRSALVCTDQLAAFARTLDLGPSMRLGRGEVQAGGRDRTVLLCGTFEALIGAIFLDSGINAVQDLMSPLLDDMSGAIAYQPELYDPKSRLQEWSQAQKLGIPHYITVQASGPDHEKLFEVEAMINGQVFGRGSGHSKQLAAQSAAQNAIDTINQSESGTQS